MKSRGKKLLSTLLVIIMVASTSVLPALAADSKTPEAQGPELSSSTESSIILKADVGYQYAIQKTEKETAVWQWADDSQYDKEEGTVSFTGLKADTAYTFARKANDAGQIEKTDIQTYRTETVTPDISKQPKDKEPVTQIPAYKKTVPPKNAQKADTPSPPDIIEKTDTTIKFALPKDLDDNFKTGYQIYFSKDGGKNYTVIPAPYEVSGLTSGTAYSYYAVITDGKYGGIDYSQSDLTETLDIITLKEAEGTPLTPELSSKTDTAITLIVETDHEYALYNGNKVSGSWNDTGIFSELNADTAYQFVSRIKATSETLPSDISQPLTVQTLKSAAAAPSAPTVADRTETSITLDAMPNQEFAIVDGTTAGKWQTSPEFTSLNPNTEYTFITRVVYNPDESMESQASAGTAAKTIIKFAGSITGVEANAAYTPGTSLTAVAIGTGMDNAAPSSGDTRWVPDSWYWNSKKVTKWDKEPYSIPFTLKTVGNYKLTVNYRLEGYDDMTWNSLEKTEAVSVAFSVKAAPVIKYTISAASGTGGKISPSGNISVEKGKNAEFTFTPDKNYQVSKVYVDGKAVKIKNNKYVFENVTSDHKISVTFEKTSKVTAAKTGDVTTLPLWIGAIISGCLVILMIAKHKARKNN